LHRLILRRISVDRTPQSDNRSDASVGDAAAGCYFGDRDINLLQ
jgi:hypothetical protein